MAAVISHLSLSQQYWGQQKGRFVYNQRPARVFIAVCNRDTGALQAGGFNPDDGGSFVANTYYHIGYLTGDRTLEPTINQFQATDDAGNRLAVVRRLESMKFTCSLMQSMENFVMRNLNTSFRVLIEGAQRLDGFVNYYALAIASLNPQNILNSSPNQFEAFEVEFETEFNPSPVDILWRDLADCFAGLNSGTGAYATNAAFANLRFAREGAANDIVLLDAAGAAFGVPTGQQVDIASSVGMTVPIGENFAHLVGRFINAITEQVGEQLASPIGD
jgi:hypothetical protein